MANSKGYSSYHGRTSLGKVIVAILLVLVILGAVAFLALQRYVVYDESGKPHLELPQQAQTDAGSSEASAQAASAASSQKQDDLNITIDQPKITNTIGVQLSADPDSWQTEVEALKAAEQNTYAVTMKESDGRLIYQSGVTGAFLADTAAEATQALTQILKADDLAVARISCFQDSLYAKANLKTAGLENTGNYVFYDGNNKNWLDPSKQATRDYLCAIAKECAEMGFDEILLTDFSYPTVGKLSKIQYGNTSKNENLTAFLQAMKAALKPFGVKLSVELPAEVISSGSDAKAGLMLSDIAAQVDRIYAMTTEAKAQTLAAAVTAVSETVEFVPEVPAALTRKTSYLVTAK